MIGTTVSHYEIREKLGAGGMGVVYKARDTRLDRWVALKFLPQHADHDPIARERFIREAKAASALEHPHICTIHEIGETDDGQLFICMAYYPGPSLRQVIRSGNLTTGRALEIGRQLCSALGRAHEEGIVHRDLKPSNIMTTSQGDTAIVDFGLAKLAGEISITRTGATMGTTAYMSPEQVSGRELDHRTDLWALGVILYQLLTGHHPFHGDYERALQRSVLEDEPAPPSSLNPEVSSHLEEVVSRLLSKDRTERYSSAGEVSQLLHGSSASSLDSRLQTEIVVPKKGPPAIRHPWRRWWPATVAAAAVVTAIAVWSPRGCAPSGTAVDLAILPFANLTGDPGNDYLARGLDQAMVGQLDQNSSIDVVDRGKVGAVPTQDREPRVVGRVLGAQFVLSGRLETRDGRSVLSASLIEVDTNGKLLETSLPIEQGDLLRAQTQLGSRVLEALGLASMAPEATESLEAYDLFFRAQDRLGQLQDPTRIESALALLRESIRLDQNFALAHAALAEVLVAAAGSTGDAALLRDAETAAQQALKIEPRLPVAQIALARVHRETNRNALAIEALQRLVSAAPDFDQAYMELAECYTRAGDLAKAETNYRQAISIRPGYWMHWNNLGTHLWMIGEIDEARATFREAIERSPPEITWAAENLASLEITVGNFERALEVYELFPRPIADALTASNIGTLHYRLDQLEEAETYFRLAVRLQPEDPALHGNLADLLHKSGLTEAAADEYRQAHQLVLGRLAQDPKSDSLKIDSALYLAKSGSCTQALTETRQLEASVASTPGNAHRLARIYAYCGDEESALRVLQLAIDLGRPVESIAIDEEFDRLSDDPEFKRLVEADGA